MRMRCLSALSASTSRSDLIPRADGGCHARQEYTNCRRERFAGSHRRCRVSLGRLSVGDVLLAMLSGNESSKDREFPVSPVGRPAGISGLSLRDFGAEATAMALARGSGCVPRRSGPAVSVRVFVLRRQSPAGRKRLAGWVWPSSPIDHAPSVCRRTHLGRATHLGCHSVTRPRRLVWSPNSWTVAATISRLGRGRRELHVSSGAGFALRDGLRTKRLKLWDESHGTLITFTQADDCLQTSDPALDAGFLYD
jgi:hypothetical protein